MNTNLLSKNLVDSKYLSEIIYFEELYSTNAYSKKIYHELKDNTIVLTSYQTNGTGRFGRPWKTNRNENLTFSLIKHYGLRIDEIHLMNFYTSYILYLTLNETSKDCSEHDLYLKWPNDLLLNRKKIAGILLDVKDMNSDTKKFIIGIGLNVNQEIFPEDINSKATSMKNEFKCDFMIEMILINFIKLFNENLNLLNQGDDLMKLWKSKSDVIDKRVKFKQLEDGREAEVVVMDIDNDGGLIVSDMSGKICKFYSGEISILYNE